MPSRDPSLTLAIARHGWVAGHRHYRLARRYLQLRKCGVVVLLLAAVASAAHALLWRPEDANNAARPTLNIEGAHCGESHAHGEADDLRHGTHAATGVEPNETMKCAAFQGGV